MREVRNNVAQWAPGGLDRHAVRWSVRDRNCTSTPALLRMLVQRLSWSKTKETKWSGSKIPRRTSLGTR